MAESRSALNLQPISPGWHSLTVDTHVHTPQLAISNDGLLLFVPHPRYLFKEGAKKIYRTRNKVITALYPLHPAIAMVVIVCTIFMVVFSPREAWVRSGWLADAVWSVDEMIPFTHMLPLTYRLVYLSALVAFFVLLLIVTVQRMLLRVLLHYKYWIFEPFGKPSLVTKVWSVLLKYLYVKRGKQMLYSFQHALPGLVVPRVEDTVRRFLRSVEPVLSEEEFEKIRGESEYFLKHHAAKLQRFLKIKSWLSDNYVTDWWLRFVYLRMRGSIFLDSNYHCMPLLNPVEYPTNPLTRAANTLVQLLKFRQLLEWEQLDPIVVGGVQPLCMEQYKNMFSTTRIPHAEEDRLRHLSATESRHFAVYYKGHWYRLGAYTKDNKRTLTAYEFYVLLDHIVKDHDRLGLRDDTPDAHIAALTTEKRATWASAREQFFQMGVNHFSLSQIENSILTLILEDTLPEGIANRQHRAFVGDGRNRWCDKSVNVIVFPNGLVAGHCEHSWADAPPLAHCLEYVVLHEFLEKNWLPDGTIPADPDFNSNDLLVPERLRFHVDPELEKYVLTAHQGALNMAAELEVAHLCMSPGKIVAKKLKLSPDSFFQMVLQLAYYRDQKQFALTYESCMTRFFRQGRTETIRSLSNESKEFVLTFEDPAASEEDKLAALRKAVSAHGYYGKLCVSGQGVDRHLFALYIVAMGTETESEFLNSLIKMKWKLSTSQIPSRQISYWPKHTHTPNFHKVGGGFGPVTDDGYGVCYLFNDDDNVIVNLSAKTPAPNTDVNRFASNIESAYRDMCSLW
eukprot:CAMPEP_0119132870 /NCGR_PEP_ID=MMETSP1310-20130426/12483_1 /TAXON_ID=464262 /ORGANISM="Genus nov. species nov., Strain RCC2339" /LENGTH=790 /DNA_ID=CAMNT_0007123535 /DNA_START=42 /DNA_END=2411 /DNA_ORIENTATION=-